MRRCWVLGVGCWVLGVGVLFAGCAKFPDTPAGPEARRVIFRMRVAREIRPDYVYIVALRTSTDPNPDPQDGPLPVVNYPNANGFVAGKPTHFILFDPTLARPFIIRKFVIENGEPNLTQWVDIGVPITHQEYVAGTRELEFEISLLQIADSPEHVEQLVSLLVNFLTMNRVSTGTGSGRVIDALGNTLSSSEINTVQRILLVSSALYSNGSPPGVEEPEGDCPDPDLDLVHWSVEVRLP